MIEYGVKCDMSIECGLCTLCEKDEMWIVHVYMAWLNDDENWWGICEIVGLSRAFSLHWIYEMGKLSRADSYPKV